MARQGETATPAVVRTGIQAYNAIREPYNTYGSDEITAQIKGLQDAGCTGGFLTWNAAPSVDKYTSLMPAFGPADTTEAQRKEPALNKRGGFFRSVIVIIRCLCYTESVRIHIFAGVTL